MVWTPPCAPTISASAPAATTSSRSSRRSAVAAPSSVSTADRSKARCTAGGRARRRTLWLASCVSNVGTWMHDTSAAWLMTGLAPSPLMVSLMQTATSLPFFLLALPAGALADIADRRRLLLVTQAWMLVAAAALGVCTVLGRTGPWLLLSLTFCMGLGNALNAPAWQAA